MVRQLSPAIIGIDKKIMGTSLTQFGSGEYEMKYLPQFGSGVEGMKNPSPDLTWVDRMKSLT